MRPHPPPSKYGLTDCHMIGRAHRDAVPMSIWQNTSLGIGTYIGHCPAPDAPRLQILTVPLHCSSNGDRVSRRAHPHPHPHPHPHAPAGGWTTNNAFSRDGRSDGRPMHGSLECHVRRGCRSQAVLMRLTRCGRWRRFAREAPR